MKRNMKSKKKAGARLSVYKEIVVITLSVLICIGFLLYFKIIQQILPSPSKIIFDEYYDETAFVRPADLSFPAISSLSTPIRLPVIMYHYVEKVKDKNDTTRIKLDTSPEVFEGHLMALRNAGYETYFVKDIPDILRGNKEISTRSAILTFDDGYDDFYTVAFPLLKKYKIRSTVYVIYDFIGRPGFLNKKQITNLIDSGSVEIGSHTLDHINLKTAKPEIARKQIGESKRLLEQDFHVEVKSFAYPIGALNPQVVEMVKEASYSGAVSVISGVMQSDENLFYLSRMRPGLFTPETMIDYLEKVRK